ncbi:MAG: PaaX family transcriptional regulator C-terminal domain-containing protein [Gemmatimonadota bacterium]
MATRRPQDLVFTLFGDFLLQRAEPVWVGSLIALLKPLGLSDGAVRTVLSRMTAKGWLSSYRHGRNSFYELTRKGRRLLEEGKARIYDPPRDKPWDGSWFLISYSIPEENRQQRDHLRTQLSWLGCGSLGYGLRICPHDVGSEVAEVADAVGCRDNVEIFRAEHLGFCDEGELVARAWDLPAINARYEAFVSSHLPTYERFRADLEAGLLQPESCFVQRFALVHEYRDFPLIDPFLPAPLQPPDWAGDCAAALFNRFHDLLMPLADRYVDSALELALEATTIRSTA